MGDLFSNLTSATRALDAQRMGLEVTGQNIANVNTPGYARRTVDMAAVAGDTPLAAGKGVDVIGIRALRDTMLERRVSQEISTQQRESTIAKGLSVVETTLGKSGATIDDGLDDFFTAFSALSQDPTSSPARQEVLVQAERLASDFRNMASRLEGARRDADVDIRATIDQVNSLTDRIAALNNAMGRPNPSNLHLRDEQTQLVRELSELVNITTVERPEGGVDIAVGSGRPLVVGETSYDITVTSPPPEGYAALAVNGMTVTSEVTGGQIGGLLDLRDTKVPGYLTSLDTLAYQLAQSVNTLHTAGYDQTGAAGGNFFTPPAAVAGAAAALAVNPVVAADGRKIAAASITQVGDNQTARGIADLRAARVLDSNTATMSDYWSQIVFRVGRDTRAATDESEARQAIVQQVDALRDEVSGVSLDEEAMQLLKFQRAYEANARFFTVIDGAIETLLNSLVR
jgi:flagellar hook-associated protein 1 FlgK